MKEDVCTQLESGALRFVRRLPGPIDRVWSYVIDPAKRRLWFAGGTMGEEAGDEFTWDFDLEALADQEVPERFPEMSGGVRTRARVLEIDPPNLLVVIGIEDPQEIRFELHEEGDEVEFVLIQGPPPEFDDLISTAAGWQACLGLLIDHLHGQAPRSFWAEHETAEGIYGERFSADG
ncbi:MAG: ATPase [Sphingomonadaceae bacterium]|nr:ATPase [Sphingomonadaceae bacterium]